MVPSYWTEAEKESLIQRAKLTTKGNIGDYLRRSALGRPLRVQMNHIAVDTLRKVALRVRTIAPDIAAEIVREIARLGGEEE